MSATTADNQLSSLSIVVLHVCCADCLLRFLLASGFSLPRQAQSLYAFPSKLSQRATQPLAEQNLHLYFANPNIYPKAEYQARLKAVQKLSTLLSIPLTIADYQPDIYFNLPAVQQQLKLGKSSTNRCATCQYLRLEKLREFTQKHFGESDYLVSTTMLASAYLATAQIKCLGKQVFGKQFWAPSFLLEPASLKTSGFYKQNYCGCFFSLQEKVRDKYCHA